MFGKIKLLRGQGKSENETIWLPTLVCIPSHESPARDQTPPICDDLSKTVGKSPASDACLAEAIPATPAPMIATVFLFSFIASAVSSK